jgi:hypothetical protein
MTSNDRPIDIGNDGSMAAGPPTVASNEARKCTDRRMWLPEGRTCRDCIRFAGCVRFFGCKAEAVTCDWSPSAFYPRDPLTALENVTP